MSTPDSTSARAPGDTCYACGHGAPLHAEMTGECVRCHCGAFMAAPATPPSDETPPYEQNPLVQQPPGVAGELPGVSEYEGAQALTSVFAFAKREYDSDVAEIVDLAGRYVAGLRLRAEAAERQLAAFTQADIDALNLYVAVGVAVCAASGGRSHGILNGGWAQEQADSLIARIAATLSSQRTL